MKKKTQALVLTLTALTSVACSHQPAPEQQLMQAVKHWDALAAVVAERVYNRLNAEHFGQVAQPLVSSLPSEPVVPVQTFTPQSASGVAVGDNYTPLHLYQGASADFQPVTSAAPLAASPGFSSAATMMRTAAFPPLYMPEPRENDTLIKKTFHNLLRTHLRRNDLMVVSRADGPYSACYSPNVPCKALTVDYDINVVRHKDRPTWPNKLDSEVAITVTASDGDFLVFSDSSIFYINTGDSDHYEQRARTFKVVNQ
jgi:hypothetical protein